MTTNNLSEHLNWLIGYGSNQPSYPAYVPTRTNPLEPIVEQPPNSPKHGYVDTKAHSHCEAEYRGLDAEFVRPQLPASVLNLNGKEVMARLQSKPASSNKPRMLSENIPLCLQTPAISSIRAPGTTLRERYSAQCERRDTGGCPRS